ncbi:hypothetical protein JZ751_029531 [Albula glossodonta]|uniref:NTR domain-containing protein n=1 Tax=Albula glossodonta TaxID=121402 RepID=A0A8T2NBN3_9TELE|nr:hypothetical protein JZ751_029531 [Albula glossodonta]
MAHGPGHLASKQSDNSSHPARCRRNMRTHRVNPYRQNYTDQHAVSSECGRCRFLGERMHLNQAGKMRVDVVWLAASVLSLPALYECDPLFVLTGPNLLRVGQKENVFVEAQEYTGGSISVHIVLMSFPGKERELFSKMVSLSAANKFQALTDVMVPDDEFPQDTGQKQYVFMQARFPAQELEKVILLSFRPGYIIAQTDKTIYTPKDRVLPDFEVTLTPDKTFFHVDDSALYLYGEDVSGEAFVEFGVLAEDGEKKRFPASLQRVDVISGKGKATLKRDHILKSFPDIRQLLKLSQYVSVSVLTESGSEMVEAEKRGILIATSPYTIHFEKTPTYFKPGMPFEVIVYITRPDDTPAEGVEVEVMPGQILGRTSKSGIARLTVNTQIGATSLPITVKTKDALLTNQRQAVEHMTALPYRTVQHSMNYLHISVQAAELQIGDSLPIKIHFMSSPGAPDEVKHLTYLVMSKGKLIRAERYERQKGQSLMTLSMTVTKDMVPSFRIVAYYHVGKEVVSDSIWVDVKDTCLGKLKVTSGKQTHANKPMGPFRMVITGDPGANVGLVAVDKHVYTLNSENRLTQSKIWDIVEKNDISCTAGSGADSMGVFYDAGLAFESNAGGTKPRTEPNCPTQTKTRRRRSRTLTNLENSPAGNYTALGRQCCMSGLEIETGPETRHPGVRTRALRLQRSKANPRTPLPYWAMDVSKSCIRSGVYGEDDDQYVDSEDIISRVQFPETWLWEMLTLPPESVSTEMLRFRRESMTITEVTAISLSSTHGICVSDPFEMKVMKDFFISLKLPYSAVRNEQVEIKAVLHNYLDTKVKVGKDSIAEMTGTMPFIDTFQKTRIVVGGTGRAKTGRSNSKQSNTAGKRVVKNRQELGNNVVSAHAQVRVELMETEQVCSSANRKGKSRLKEVYVDAKTSHAVPFVIVPMAIGQYPIEVKAAIYGSHITDGIRKHLRVVAEGIKIQQKPRTFVLDPSKHGGVQTLRIDGQKLESQVPGSPADTYVSLIVDLPSQTIPAAIGGSALGSLIAQPTGDGEVNMITMTGPVIATHYLDRTLHWDQVGIDRRTQAIKFIKEGYSQQLKFRKADGSYSTQPQMKASTCLTAYVAKVFHMMLELINMEENVVCSAIKWLVFSTQEPGGAFKENAPGGVQGEDVDATMTAFVLIAMQESRHICIVSVSILAESIRMATKFLSERIKTLTNPYAVAIAAYALANEGQHQLEILNRFSSDKTHWPVQDDRHSTLEATGYALMALVKAKEFDQAGRVVKWLTEQEFPDGGYGSTQANVIVLQSVVMYVMELPNLSAIDLNVMLDLGGRRSVRWAFNRANANVARSTHIRTDQSVTVTAKGTGKGILSLVTVYNALPEGKTDCKDFELDVKLQKEPKDATMSILDVTMLTGFIADKDDLNKLTSGRDRYVQKIETDKQLSEKGSLIFYLDKVSHKQSDRVVFRIHKTNRVGLLQPAAVTVYEYNSLGELLSTLLFHRTCQKNRCVKFYHPERKGGALNRICHEDVCRCAEENCSYQKDPNLDLYKAKVVHANLSTSIDRFTFQVEDIFKEGKSLRILEAIMSIRWLTPFMLSVSDLSAGSDVGVKGKQRSILSHPHCRGAIDLKPGKSYLIMGPSEDIVMRQDRLLYMLGGGTWIEYWPTEVECRQPAYRDTCLGITSSTSALDFGCLT